MIATREHVSLRVAGMALPWSVCNLQNLNGFRAVLVRRSSRLEITPPPRTARSVSLVAGPRKSFPLSLSTSCAYRDCPRQTRFEPPSPRATRASPQPCRFSCRLRRACESRGRVASAREALASMTKTAKIRSTRQTLPPLTRVDGDRAATASQARHQVLAKHRARPASRSSRWCGSGVRPGSVTGVLHPTRYRSTARAQRATVQCPSVFRP
jgi:hypothetical protein